MKEWQEWIDWYSSLWAFRGPERLQMLIGWVNIFGRMQYTPAEMKSAGERLACNTPPPRFPGDHLTGLLALAKANRAAKQAAPVEDRGACILCRGTAWICVIDGYELPLPLKDGTLSPVYTCAMACTCYQGRNMLANWGGGGTRHSHQSPMSFDDYRRRFPAWEDWAEEQKGIRDDLRRVHQEAAQVDRQGPVERASDLVSALATQTRFEADFADFATPGAGDSDEAQGVTGQDRAGREGQGWEWPNMIAPA